MDLASELSYRCNKRLFDYLEGDHETQRYYPLYTVQLYRCETGSNLVIFVIHQHLIEIMNRVTNRFFKSEI